MVGWGMASSFDKNPLGLPPNLLQKMIWKEACAALIGGTLLGWLACGLWAKNTTFWLVIAVIPGLLAAGSWMRGIWYVALGMSDPCINTPPVFKFIGFVLAVGLVTNVGLNNWWWKPESEPLGRFKITESRGFGAEMTGQFMEVAKSYEGKRQINLLGRGIQARVLFPEHVRRAVGKDCAWVFKRGEGTAFCEYDRVLGMWRIDWAGLGQERWLLMRAL